VRRDRETESFFNKFQFMIVGFYERIKKSMVTNMIIYDYKAM